MKHEGGRRRHRLHVGHSSVTSLDVVAAIGRPEKYGYENGHKSDLKSYFPQGRAVHHRPKRRASIGGCTYLASRGASPKPIRRPQRRRSLDNCHQHQHPTCLSGRTRTTCSTLAKRRASLGSVSHDDQQRAQKLTSRPRRAWTWVDRRTNLTRPRRTMRASAGRTQFFIGVSTTEWSTSGGARGARLKTAVRVLVASFLLSSVLTDATPATTRRHPYLHSYFIEIFLPGKKVSTVYRQP
jgi:hypothetical protein